MQTIAGLTRITVADVIGDDDEIFFGIKKLALPKKDTAEPTPEKLGVRASGSMKNKYRVRDHAILVFFRFADRNVMNLQLGERFATFKCEALYHEISRDRTRKSRGLRADVQNRKREEDRDQINRSVHNWVGREVGAASRLRQKPK